MSDTTRGWFTPVADIPDDADTATSEPTTQADTNGHSDRPTTGGLAADAALWGTPDDPTAAAAAADSPDPEDTDADETEVVEVADTVEDTADDVAEDTAEDTAGDAAAGEAEAYAAADTHAQVTDEGNAADDDGTTSADTGAEDTASADGHDDAPAAPSDPTPASDTPEDPAPAADAPELTATDDDGPTPDADAPSQNDVADAADTEPEDHTVPEPDTAPTAAPAPSDADAAAAPKAPRATVTERAAHDPVDDPNPLDASCVVATGATDADIPNVVVAHRAAFIGPLEQTDPITLPAGLAGREQREQIEDQLLAPGATRAYGPGTRQVDEDADEWRTCFERDLDRIKHSRAFRRLAGKCQVFIAPYDDHLRTRLTHAVEVAQVATAVARAARLNVSLVEASALGHDCGHGPAGHASEEALSPYLPDGYDHAPYGADVVLRPMNLCEETLDAIRNHSWKRPSPATAEGEIVSWADRVAYVCHDFEDAVRAGIVTQADLPDSVADTLGRSKSRQLDALITSMVRVARDHGVVGMYAEQAEALAEWRRFNFERIYLRDASVAQATKVIALLRQVVDHLVANPDELARRVDRRMPWTSEQQQVASAVEYVSGMTDRYALAYAVEHLGWAEADLPRGA